MNMKNWVYATIASDEKKAMPILSFPSIQLTGSSVNDLVMSSELQAEGMKRIAERTDSLASVSMMDLSVEAEAFGATIRFSDSEVPTVLGRCVEDEEDAEKLEIPDVGKGRTGVYVEAIRKASEKIQDRPVFAGGIGPFSLAGRLLDVSEIMYLCYDDETLVHKVLAKATQFIIDYALAYREVGASGIVIAEPLAGLLTPAMNAEFSVPYVKQIVEAVQNDHFVVIYHNCGNGAGNMVEDLLQIGAVGYHFGNAVNLEEVLKKIPSDVLVFGNIDPASQFCNGTPESIREATWNLLESCSRYKNFVISSGCDIPPKSKWENIDSFFQTVADFYAKNK